MTFDGAKMFKVVASCPVIFNYCAVLKANLIPIGFTLFN